MNKYTKRNQIKSKAASLLTCVAIVKRKVKQNTLQKIKIKTQNNNNYIWIVRTYKHLNNRESQRILRVVHLNIEGLSREKSEILNKMFKDVDVLALQETYIPKGETIRLRIPDFNMVDYKRHPKYELATYINQ